MKTVRFTNEEVKRVSNEQAEALVLEGKATYVPKKVWKQSLKERSKETPKQDI